MSPATATVPSLGESSPLRAPPPPTKGVLGVALEGDRQETIDLVYEQLVTLDGWPEAIEVSRRLLECNAVELRSAMVGAGWLFPLDDISDLTGSIKLTFAGLCLAKSSAAREDVTHVLRFVRAAGRLATLRKDRTRIAEADLATEMGETTSGHRLLLCEATIIGLGLKMKRERSKEWSIQWDDRLMPLSIVETADGLLSRMFGLGAAEHQARHYPATRAAIQPVSDRDQALFKSLLTALPYNGSIRFIEDANLAGFSFNYSRLSDLDTFVYDWNDAGHRFHHPLLERGRRILHTLAQRYVRYISAWTFRTREWQSVPPEWEDEQPVRFRWVVDELHRMAGEIVHVHQEFVTLAAVLVP